MERKEYIPAIRAANAAAEEARAKFGASLRHLDLDWLSVSEHVRLAIASAGYFQVSWSGSVVKYDLVL